MRTWRFGLLATAGVVLLSSGTARAQSAATCSFDGATATLTITMNGEDATLSRSASGQIRLNNVACPGASVITTDSIQVNGSAFDDFLTVTGSFSPGLTPEDDVSEIEIDFDLGAGTDTARFNFTDQHDEVMFDTQGIDIGSDLDMDYHTTGVELVKVYALGGDDSILGSWYAGGGRLYLYGGDGNDSIYGSSQNDSIYGQAGNDSLFGAFGADTLYGGPGDDHCDGEGDDDVLWQELADGNDQLYGGAGVDTVDYSKRTVGVTVTIGNGMADDGEAGVEADWVDVDVENVTGGSGDDVLVGSAAVNRLLGGPGNDELYGGLSNDVLRGFDGDDILVGDGGGDTMLGEKGNDSIDGGNGPDKMYGGPGADTLTGGPGTDQFFGEGGNDLFFNGDGVAETVDCGPGLGDDPEPDASDTFVGCEQI